TCASCHKTGGAPFHATTFAGIEPAHNNVQADASCAGCHATTGVNRLSQHRNDCAVCHSSTNATVQAAIAAGATTAQNCASCHKTGGALTHGTTFATVAPVHDMVISSASCSSCHVQGTAEQRLSLHLSCAQCHTSTSQTVIDAINAGQAGTAVSCASCHGSLGHAAAHDMTAVPQPSCNDCHDSNVYIEHVERRSLSCSVCHDNPAYASTIAAGMAGSQVLCAACHGTTQHHTGSDAISGNCQTCHLDPRPVIWAGAPVGQMACQECHTDASGRIWTWTAGAPSHAWNTAAPIQDFGACFACHAPVPFHGLPVQAPLCWDLANNYFAAPGKGTFNLFRPMFQKPLEYYKGTPYQRQGKEICKPDRADWNNPTITFNWHEISSPDSRVFGQTVPTFEPASAGCLVQPIGTYIEAEKAGSIATADWATASETTANGGQYLNARTARTTLPNAAAGPGAQFRLSFPAAGTYYLFFRSKDNRSTSSDNLWYGLNGVGVGDAKSPVSNTNYNWFNARGTYTAGPTTARITVPSAGWHTINIWSKETNHRFDGLYISTMSGALPPVALPGGARKIDATQCISAQ
ncbi:MAG: hypothetical protein AB1634_19350, partial [Thermodesulfobacteriota bacterium]